MGSIDDARRDMGYLVYGDDHPAMHRILDDLAERIAELEAACRAALDYITGDGWNGTIGQHADNPLPTQLLAALKTGERK